jgi:hypothetical protein
LDGRRWGTRTGCNAALLQPRTSSQGSSFCLLCCCRSRAAGIPLPPQGAGVLWGPTTALVTALLHFGGNLHPLLWDVHRCAAIDSPLSVVPRVTLGWEGDKPDRHLLLLAPSPGTSCLHCSDQPRQVGPLEGGLDDRAGRPARSLGVFYWGPNRK